jgi:hypothetical protein
MISKFKHILICLSFLAVVFSGLSAAIIFSFISNNLPEKVVKFLMEGGIL